MASGIEYLRRDSDHCIAVWKNVLVWFSVGEVGGVEADKALQYFDMMAKRHPEGFCFALYAKDTCKLPNAAARHASKSVFEAQRGRMTAMAALFEGHGFFMSSCRAILSTMLAVARQPFESRVSGDVDEISAWVCTMLPGLRDLPDAAAELAEVYREVAAEQASIAAA